MKIIVSTESVRFPLTGIGRYAYELAKHLGDYEHISSLRYYNGNAVVKHLPEDTGQSTPAQAAFKLKLKRWVQSNAFASEAYRQLLPLKQRTALKGLESYLFHGTNFYLPAFSGKKVATFHDLSPFNWAHCHPVERVRFMQKELRKTLSVADALITDSEYVRQEIMSTFDWAPEKVHTVPLAAGPEFFPRDEDALLPTLSKYGLEYKKYSLFVGTIEPRKNIISLLDAYAKLPLALRKAKPLVLAGYYGWNSEDIHKRIEKGQSQGWVQYLGFTPAVELPLLFAGADLFIFPSLYEGFGLPPLEAMQSGVPVVCSNSASLPEVVGNAALMCDAGDVDTLAKNIQSGLEDQPWRHLAIERGLLRSQQFTWSKCAQATLAVYRSVVDE